jgi:hypothetical protein
VPGADEGLLVKVLAIDASGQQTTLRTAPAHLEDAVRRAHIHARFALPASVATPAEEISPSATSEIVTAAFNAADTSDGPSFDWTDTYNPTALQGKGCTAPPKLKSKEAASPPPLVGTDVSFTPSVHFGIAPVVDFTADVSMLPPSVKVSFTVGVKEDFSAGLVATAAYSCDITKSFDLGSLPQFPLPVPGTPFHLTVTPKLSAKGEVKGKADGKVDLKVIQSAKPSITLAYDDGFKLDAGFHPDPVQVTKTGVANGGGEISIAPQLKFDVQGRGGPYVSVLGYVMGAATTSPPGAGLWIGGSGNVGIDLDLFVKTIRYERPVFPFGPDLVWHTGTTPEIPYDTPTLPAPGVEPGIPSVTCVSNCTVESDTGATITLSDSPTFRTPDQACVGFIVRIAAGKADYIGDGFAAMNGTFPNSVYPCARASVNGARCVSPSMQFRVKANTTQTVAYCFTLDYQNTIQTPYFFSMGGDVDFDVSPIGATPEAGT